MAVFTGLNLTYLKQTYHLRSRGGLDDVQFIWKSLHDSGYSTLYAEDSTTGQIFNYAAAGFMKQPTDHYYHPFPLTLENHVGVTIREGMMYCAGFNHSGEYVYKYGVDAAKLYNNKNPFFGFTWSNHFSHDSWDLPTAMEMPIKGFIEELKLSGVLDKYAMVILSDHGRRYGKLRITSVGFKGSCINFVTLKRVVRDEGGG
jgi:hypothetical protein